MGILEIKKYPAKVLRRKAQPVAAVTQEDLRLLDDMVATMRRSSGIGLAAPQVGINKRFIVADVGQGPLKLTNPELIKAKGREKMEEACLSVPGALVNIQRPTEVVVRGLNERGQMIEINAKGLLARVLLHEIDHLNGKLIVDYMGLLKRIKLKFMFRPG